MAKVLLILHLCERVGLSLEHKSIFDYGFGAGTFFRYCPPSSRLFGVEMDAENVTAVRAMLEARGIHNADLRPIEVDHWSEHPLLQQTYDIVLCSHVLEHLPDPVSFLGRMRHCLNPCGVFLGLVPLNERKLDPHHVRRVDRRTIETWSTSAGLKLVTYLEDDPWLYWLQPLFTSKTKIVHGLAQAISLSLGVPATVVGHRSWFRLGKLMAKLTKSHPIQAAFLLTSSPCGTGPAR